MGTPNKYRPEMCETAIKVLSDGESVVAVAAELGVCRNTVYEWKDEHPEFKKAIDAGLAQGQRHWELLGKQGAFGSFEKFSAPAWIFTMKNRFRDDYADEKKDDKDNAQYVLENIINGKLKVQE